MQMIQKILLIILLLNKIQCKNNIIQLDIIPYEGSAFLLNVQLGKPSQKIQMRVDTGSNEIVVPSIKCKQCKVKYQFDINKSKTLRIIENVTYPRCYGDGCYNGMTVKDYFFYRNKYQKYLSFFLANSCAFPLGGVQGILGLGMDAYIINVLKKQGDIQHASFSLLLRYKKGKSKLYLGGYNPNDFYGKLVYQKIVSNSHYLIQIQDLKVNGLSLFSVKQKYQGFLDSGNSNFGFTEDMYQKYVKYMATKGVTCYKKQQTSPRYYSIICYQSVLDPKNHYPNLQFYFSNHKLVMNSKKYVINCYKTKKYGRKVKECNLGLETGGGLIFGSIFFDTFYIYFNQENQTIGIAKSKTL